jgi:hypothetical protein
MRIRTARIVTAGLAVMAACAACGGAAGPTSTTAATLKPANSVSAAGYSAVPPSGNLTFVTSFVVPKASCTNGSVQHEGLDPMAGATYKYKGKYTWAGGTIFLECWEGGMLPDGVTIQTGASSKVFPQGLSPLTGDHITLTVTVTPSSSRVAYVDLTHRYSASVSSTGGEAADVSAELTSYQTSQTNIYPPVNIGKITFTVGLDGKAMTSGHALQATDLVSKAGKLEITTSPLSGGTTFSTTQ